MHYHQTVGYHFFLIPMGISEYGTSSSTAPEITSDNPASTSRDAEETTTKSTYLR
jgi:hypothetical protein